MRRPPLQRHYEPRERTRDRVGRMRTRVDLDVGAGQRRRDRGADDVRELFPIQIRAAGISVAYALTATIFGSTTQFVIARRIGVTGDSLAPAYDVVGSSVSGIAALSMLRETGVRPGRFAARRYRLPKRYNGRHAYRMALGGHDRRVDDGVGGEVEKPQEQRFVIFQRCRRNRVYSA